MGGLEGGCGVVVGACGADVGCGWVGVVGCDGCFWGLCGVVSRGVGWEVGVYGLGWVGACVGVVGGFVVVGHIYMVWVGYGMLSAGGGFVILG